MKIEFKQIKLLSITLVILIGALSCTSDLDIVPSDDQDILGEDLFKNESSYERVIAGVRNNFV